MTTTSYEERRIGGPHREVFYRHHAPMDEDLVLETVPAMDETVKACCTRLADSTRTMGKKGASEVAIKLGAWLTTLNAVELDALERSCYGLRDGEDQG
jgi:hypothetical protein